MGMTRRMRDKMLAADTTTDGGHDPAATFLFLFTSLTAHGLDTALADFGRPSGTVGGGQQVTPWGTAYNLTDGSSVRDGPPLEFRPASSADGCTALGWFTCDNNPPANVMEWGYFPADVVLADENDAVTLIMRAQVDPAGRASNMVVIDG